MPSRRMSSRNRPAWVMPSSSSYLRSAYTVMAGLVAAIHEQNVDHRDKHGDDDGNGLHSDPNGLVSAMANAPGSEAVCPAPRLAFGESLRSIRVLQPRSDTSGGRQDRAEFEISRARLCCFLVRGSFRRRRWRCAAPHAVSGGPRHRRAVPHAVSGGPRHRRAVPTAAYFSSTALL